MFDKTVGGRGASGGKRNGDIRGGHDYRRHSQGANDSSAATTIQVTHIQRSPAAVAVDAAHAAVIVQIKPGAEVAINDGIRIAMQPIRASILQLVRASSEQYPFEP